MQLLAFAPFAIHLANFAVKGSSLAERAQAFNCRQVELPHALLESLDRSNVDVPERGHYASSEMAFSLQDPKSMLQKLRLIHLVFLVSIPLCAWVAQSACPSNSSDWTVWHWVITGLALYAAFVGFFYRRKLVHSSEEALRRDASNSKALRQWQAAQIVGMAAAEAIAFYGVVLQMVLGGPRSQASFFYAIGLLLLLLWRPQIPTTVLSA